MLVLRSSMLKELRKSKFESFNKLFVDFVAMKDNFAQDLKIDKCFAIEDANVNFNVKKSIL